MKNRTALGHRLIDISERLEKDPAEHQRLSGELEKLGSRILQRRNQKGHLTTDQVKIIARLFHRTIGNHGRQEPISLLNELYRDQHLAIENLKYIVGLIELRIIDCDEKRYRKVRGRNRQVTLKIDHSSLIDVYIGFTGRFMSFLLHSAGRSYRTAPRPFRRNKEYVEHWFDYVESLHSCRQEDLSRRHAHHLENEAVDKWEELTERSKVTAKLFPFEQLTSEYDLSHEEQIVTMYVLQMTVEDRPTTEYELLTLLRDTKFDRFSKPAILSKDGILLREGIILPSDGSNLGFRSEDFEIAPDIGARILCNKRQSIKATTEDIVKHEDLLEICIPTKCLSQIVLPRDTMEVVRKAKSVFDRDCHRALTRWGIYGGTSRIQVPSRSGEGRLVMLIHGPPGTGKTALSHALARSLGRILLTTDISRILDKWVGESEKRLSRMFLVYRKIVHRVGKTPVLLLNEADQLLSRRGSALESVDRMYNQMQNILLENLETFQGILIATTNMVENLDDAFSRRFDIKIKLEMPALQERKKLWRKLIPRQLPLADDVDTNTLAKQYLFSGGQIELVIRNTAIAAADRPKSKQVVHQADLIKYAELELDGSFDHNNGKVVGFV